MCVEIARGRMTIKEARTALKELILTATNTHELGHFNDLDRLNDEELKDKALESIEDKNN